MKLNLKEIEELIDGSLNGDYSKEIYGINSLENADINQISFAVNEKYKDAIVISDAGEFYYSDGSPNLKVSHYYPETNNSYKAHLQAVSDEACDYKTIGRTEYLEPIELNIDFDLDKIKYLNTPVNTTNNSNADSYIWDINGVKSFGFEAASISYSEANDYQYKLIGQSKYGCSDSVEKSIKVLKKAPGFPSDHSICQQGPIASKVNLGFNAYKSHIDNNGNLYVVGSNYSNTGGDYSGSMNWFVEKFSEDGTQIWKKE